MALKKSGGNILQVSKNEEKLIETFILHLNRTACIEKMVTSNKILMVDTIRYAEHRIKNHFKNLYNEVHNICSALFCTTVVIASFININIM